MKSEGTMLLLNNLVKCHFAGVSTHNVHQNTAFKTHFTKIIEGPEGSKLSLVTGLNVEIYYLERKALLV